MRYYIIAGERRYRAFELLGKKEIPAIIKEMTDEEMLNQIKLLNNILGGEITGS